MNHQRTLTLLTVLNLGILGFLLFHQVHSVQAGNSAGMLRGRGLEIVDAQGKVRASIHIVPEGPGVNADGSIAKGGKIYPETVRFRLIRTDGRPSVKITASEKGSGLTLGGGIDPTCVVISADGDDPSLSLTNQKGKLQVIKP